MSDVTTIDYNLDTPRKNTIPDVSQFSVFSNRYFPTGNPVCDLRPDLHFTNGLFTHYVRELFVLTL